MGGFPAPHGLFLSLQRDSVQKAMGIPTAFFFTLRIEPYLVEEVEDGDPILRRF